MIHTLCYTSKTNDLSASELKSIFEKTYTNNTLKKITGLLIHADGHFFQVLEGDPKIVLPLYNDVIVNDTRHFDIFKIIDKPKPASLFKEYSSSFNIVRSHKQLENLKEYLCANKENTTADKINRLLEPFSVFL